MPDNISFESRTAAIEHEIRNSPPIMPIPPSQRLDFQYVEATISNIPADYFAFDGLSMNNDDQILISSFTDYALKQPRRKDMNVAKRYFKNRTELANFYAGSKRPTQMPVKIYHFQMFRGGEKCRDCLSGHSVWYCDTREANVYGSSIRTSLYTSHFTSRLGLVWVQDLKTYISQYDPNVDLLKISNTWFQRAYFETNKDNTTIFQFCMHGGDFELSQQARLMHDGLWATQEWYEQNGFECDDCESRFNSFDRHGRWCETCYARHEDDDDETDPDNILDSYGTKAEVRHGFIHKHNIGHTSECIFYGLELELEAIDESSRNLRQAYKALRGSHKLVVAGDGSLDYGLEIKTPPIDSRLIRKFTKNVLETVSVLPLEARDTCGLHIHISRKPLGELVVGRMTLFLNHCKNENFIDTIAGREANDYCGRYAWDALKDIRRYRGKIVGNEERYSAINLELPNTIELRLFAASTEANEILARLEFAMALVEYCRVPTVTLREFVKWQNFVEWLRQPRHTKDYTYLVKYLKKERNYAIMLSQHKSGMPGPLGEMTKRVNKKAYRKQNRNAA